MSFFIRLKLLKNVTESDCGIIPADGAITTGTRYYYSVSSRRDVATPANSSPAATGTNWTKEDSLGASITLQLCIPYREVGRGGEGGLLPWGPTGVEEAT